MGRRASRGAVVDSLARLFSLNPYDAQSGRCNIIFRVGARRGTRDATAEEARARTFWAATTLLAILLRKTHACWVRDSECREERGG